MLLEAVDRAERAAEVMLCVADRGAAASSGFGLGHPVRPAGLTVLGEYQYVSRRLG